MDEEKRKLAAEKARITRAAGRERQRLAYLGYGLRRIVGYKEEQWKLAAKLHKAATETLRLLEMGLVEDASDVAKEPFEDQFCTCDQY